MEHHKTFVLLNFFYKKKGKQKKQKKNVELKRTNLL